MRALDQRAKTILKVSAEIVPAKPFRPRRPVLETAQPEDRRRRHLDAQIDRLARHRQQIHGDQPRHFELKYFFTSSISSSDGGEAHSAEAVRHRIRLMIEAEAPDDVLSGSTIVDLKAARGSGIDIARRTVAKYREAMKIPSSVQRRLEKHTSLARAD